jgi:hypothetical protein
MNSLVNIGITLHSILHTIKFITTNLHHHVRIKLSPFKNNNLTERVYLLSNAIGRLNDSMKKIENALNT